MAPECAICALESSPPEGGWYHQDEHWSVGPHLTSGVPGWIVLYLRRHAPGLSDMTGAELQSMGPVLAAAARAIEAETDAERVYFASFGENIAHVHVLVIPRGPGIPAQHRSSRLHVNAAQYADPAAASEVGARLRRRMAAQ